MGVLDSVGKWLLGRDKPADVDNTPDLFRQGKVVRLPVIDGHRDTNATECPGQVLYDLLPKLRNRTGNRVDRFD